MIIYIATLLYLYFFCLLLAFLEVQIEGKAGWAKNLPAWKPSSNSWYSSLYSRIMKGKELTGYHVGMFSLVLFVLHGFFFWNGEWSFLLELQVLSHFFLVSVVWDFLWFVINPAYGWSKFKPIHIAWHKSWLGPWPLDYYYGIVIAAVLYAFSYNAFLVGLWEWLKIFLVFFVLTIITVLVRYFFDKRS